MASFVHVDNSNVFIEGRHVSAVKKGMVPNTFEAQQKRICDRDYKIDYGRLNEFLGASKDATTKLFRSRPPHGDTVWDLARRAGFEVFVFDSSEWRGQACR